MRSFIELDLDRADACLAPIAQAEAIPVRVAPDDFLVGRALNIRASALAPRGELRDALAASEAAAQFFATRLGRRAEECLFARQNAGGRAEKLGRMAQAKALLTEVVEDAHVTFGERAPRLAYAEHALATVLLARNERPGPAAAGARHRGAGAGRGHDPARGPARRHAGPAPRRGAARACAAAGDPRARRLEGPERLEQGVRRPGALAPTAAPQGLGSEPPSPRLAEGPRHAL
jgi:hypothetical protein